MKSLLPNKIRPVLTALVVISLGAHAYLSLIYSPKDEIQGDAVRLLYLHVPAAWLAYVSFAVTTLCSVLYLIPKTRSNVYDILAGASAKAGIIFCSLTLILGALWGKPIWGVFWAWDARITSTTILLFLYIGYVAIRTLARDEKSRKRNAYVALFAFVDVPVVHFSVSWWRTLHQEGTVFSEAKQANISGSMAVSLLVGVIAFTLLYVYMLDRQFNHDMSIENNLENSFDEAIENRKNEVSK